MVVVVLEGQPVVVKHTEVDIASPAGVQRQGGIARGTVLRVELAYVFVKAGFVGHVRT